MRTLEQILEAYGSSFHPVVPFHPRKDKLLLLDFTEANRTLTAEVLGQTELFTRHINLRLDHAGARYGIGGYAEDRAIYRRSPVFAGKGGEGPRSIHLGIDIWGKPLTHVFAPLDGFVHSFRFNHGFGDYGATIILSHQLEGLTFYTLYGHLSLASIRNLQGGETVRKGDVFAEFGIQQENGNWPPHLHFQIIRDLEGMKGDYPGVCTSAEQHRYLANCPNPDLLLRMMAYAQPA